MTFRYSEMRNPYTVCVPAQITRSWARAKDIFKALMMLLLAGIFASVFQAETQLFSKMLSYNMSTHTHQH
jgi:hypothetical protein